MKTKISRFGRSSVSVILAVMMLLSTMLIGTVSTVNAVDLTKFSKVYLDANVAKYNPNEDMSQTKPTNAYAFHDINGGQSTYTEETSDTEVSSWPGGSLKPEGNGIYSILVSNDATKIIFNSVNGGKQTGNLTLPSNWKTTTMIYRGDGTAGSKGWEEYSTSVKVADSVTLTANPTSVKAGKPVTLTPTVISAKSGDLTYTYNKISGGTATEVKNADNSLTVTPTVAGTYKYKVTVSADSYSPVTSNEVSFTVTDSVKYYICGRFNNKWHDPSDNDPQFVEDESNPGLFYYETGETIAQLSGTISETYGDTPKYFYIYKTAKNESTNYLTTSDNAGHNFQNNTVNNPLPLMNQPGTEEKRLVRFNDDKDTSTTPVTIWLDTRNNEYKLWYTTALPHKVNVAEGVSATVDKATATTGEKVTVTAIPENGKVLDKVTVVGEDGSTPIETTVSGNTATFTMPDQDVTVTNVTFREAKKYTVKFSSSDDNFGSVSAKYNGTDFTSDTKVTEGDEVTFTATSKDGYALSDWTVNGVSASSTTNPYTITVQKDTTVVANFKEVTGTLSKYYLLCGTGATFKADSYTHVPLYTNEDGVFYADFDVAKDSIPKSKDYFIIFSTKEDTSGIIVDSNNVTVNAVNKNGFSLSDYNENVQNPSGGTNNVKFAKVYIDKDDVTGFTIKITGLDLGNKKITYSAEPTFDVAPADTVEITAKDGTIRAGYTDTDASKTTAVLGDTTLSITTPDDKIITASDSYMIEEKNRAVTAKRVPNGSTVTVTTTINPNATFAGHKGSDYYVKGFSVNGVFGGVLSQTDGKNHSGDVYTYTFEVNQEIYGSKLEITPVYFLKNDDNCVYFYIENYDSAKQIWGNTPSCYVYYGSGKTTLEALGYYPGQPMVDYNGSIFTQIPKFIVNGDTTEKITGMTLNNYVWDDVHRDYNGKDQKSDNAQTYDYDDFVKIAESGAAADNIIYRFKYNEFDNEPADTFAASKADAAGWEVFLDYQNYPTDIFGNKIGTEKLDYKDTKSVTSKDNYLSIISDGYQNNYIGKYATAWSIYNKAGDRVATIPSSALLYALGKTDEQMETAIGSESTPTDFLPGKDNRDKHWATFKTLYNDYKGVYAQINFEAAIKGGDDYGNRLDGRWYYSQSKQKITGEIKIQYANTLDDYKVGGFHEDTFADEDASSIIGTTTGASAYFTDPKDKVRKLETEADNTQDYKFEVTATSTAAYTFVGWYRLIDGDYKAINPSDMSSLTGAVTRNSDVTLVARYIKTPGGSMTFHHSLYNGTNAGGGKATPEIQVVVKNNEGKSLYDSGRIAGTASIDKTKIAELASQTGLTVTVTLYTTTKNLYNFNGYYSAENTTDITAFAPTTGFTTNVSGDRTEGLVTTSEYTFSFNDYYTKHKDTLIGDNAGTVYYNFYSDITSIKVPYKVQFSYTDRMGNQKYYNKAGYVDPENTSSYTFDENATNVEGVESHSVKVTLTNSFILSLAPYESNFTKNLTWNETPDSNTAFDSSVTNSIASAVVNSTQSDRTIHLNVFRDNNGVPTPRTNTDGAFELFTKNGSSELPYNSVFYTKNSDGTYTYDITAPKTYTDKGKTLQFMYWAIYSDPGCNNLVIKAYNIDGGFSYVSYDNYWIVPVYGESSTPVASVKEVYTSTQFMEVTRNQWTAGNADSFNGFDADSMTTLDTAADFIKGNGEDKLYADFVLNFFYNGKQLNVFDPNSSKVQTGIVMQKLELEKDSIGVGYNTDMKYYANKYTADLSVAAEDAKSKILTGESSIESLTKQINNNRLNNKNRLQYFARFNNTEANANCVYRVYTYIKYVNESNETVVELGDPIYFTLYDIANATV
nr:starch-binding protein [Ruminococcus bromii]